MKTVICNVWESYNKIDDFIEWCSKYFIAEKKPKTRKKLQETCKYFGSCDFETTNDKELKQAFVYSWAFCFMGRVLVGRDMRSFMYFCKELSDALGDMRLLIYFHNYSYDVNFIMGYYHFTPEECFFTRPRKVLYTTMYGNLEMRCSYLLTGLNLKNFTKEMRVKHQKKSGERFNYDKYRTPKSGLHKKNELIYIINDVRGLWEALNEYYQGDTTFTIPYTKTGFVRRDIKKACARISYSKRRSWGLDLESYYACREAFRGGNTHCARWYAEKDCILENVHSNDFVSCYPSMMLSSSHFPARAFTRKGALTWSEYLFFIEQQKMCGIFRLHLSNVRLRIPWWACPYLPLAKVRNEKNEVVDNGRILACDECDVTMTDIDISILLFEYDCIIEITDSFIASCAPLEPEIKNVIMKYYEMKTSLRDVPGMETIYSNEKTKLNASYGCLVQNSVQNLIIYDDAKQQYYYSKKVKVEGEERIINDDRIRDQIMLEQFNKKGLPNYAIGVFITALARLELEKMIAKLPPFSFVYADTDSVKYVNCDPGIFEDYNNKMREFSEANGLYADNKYGKRKYLNQFEHEIDYPRFTTLGAKKYAYEDENGKLHITCAGVNKKLGAIELEENGGLSAFKNGFIFNKSGGITATYNDFSHMDIERGGEKIEIRKNIYLESSTYTLGQGDGDYEQIIEIACRFLHGEIDNEFSEWYIDNTD